MHAACTSAALQPKPETALFETALAPVRLCSFDQHCCTEARTEPLCMLLAPLLPCSPSRKQPSLRLHLHPSDFAALTNTVARTTFPAVPWCSARQADSRRCVTAITPMEICYSHRCAVSQQKCTAALVWAESIPRCSVVLCKTGSQQALCHCNYIYGDLLFTQVCIEPTEMHCSTGLGKMHSPLFRGALQDRLTAGAVSLQLHL